MTEIIFEPFSGPSHHSASSGATSLLPLIESIGAETLTLPAGAAYLPAIVEVSPTRILDGTAVLQNIDSFGVELLSSLGGRGELPGVSAYGSDSALVPTFILGYGFLPAIQSEGFSIVNHVANQDVDIPSILSRAYEVESNIGAADLPNLESAGLDHIPLNYVTIFMSSGYAQLVGGQEALIAVDGGNISATLLSSYEKTIIENLVGAANVSSVLQGMNVLTQAGAITDTAAHITMLLLESTATIADDPNNFLRAVETIIDTLVATEVVATSFEAFCLVIEVIQSSDTAVAAIIDTLVDSGVSTDESTALIRAIAGIVETAELSDELENNIRVLLLLQDSGDIADDVSTQLTALLDALESGEAVASLSLAGEAYTAYAMTLTGAAMNEYVGYNFNSFAVINGQAYGAASERGIFLLEGDTDDGTPIDARVRVGMSNFGTALKKEISYAYIGYTTDGQLAMKVTTTSRDKGKRENWYTFSAKPRNATSEDRIAISKGKQSVYWDWELINIDGADFEFDELRVWVMPLNRRK